MGMGPGTGTKLHIQSLLGNEYQVLTGMFVCLTGWSVWIHAWVLMGPGVYYYRYGYYGQWQMGMA